MAQVWTIIFIAFLALAAAFAHWQDCCDARRRNARNAAHERERARKEEG